MALNLGGLLGGFIPESAGLSEKDRQALGRQGLLSLGLGLLKPSGGSFGGALSNGIQSGLLAVNQGAENLGNMRYKSAMLANQAGGGSEFKALDAKARAAGYEPGTDDYKRAVQIDLGVLPRAVTGAAKPQTIIGADGRQRIGTFDPTTRQWSVFDGQNWVVAGPGQAPVSPGAASVYIDPSLPPEVQAAIRANPEDPQLGTPQAPLQAADPGLFIGRPREAEAGAVAGAQAAATMPYTMAEINARTNAGIRQADVTGQYGVRDALATASGKTQIENQAALNVAQATKQRDAGTALDLLARAQKILPQATGGDVGAAFDRANSLFGRGTQGAQKNAQLKTIAGQLTSKMPRMEGPQSDRDVEMYKQMAGDLGNENLPVSVRMAALEEIRALNQKYAGRPSRTTPAAASGQGYRSESAPKQSGQKSNYSDLWN